MEPFSWFTQAMLDAEINDVVRTEDHSLKIDVKFHKLVPDSTHASDTGKYAIPILAPCILSFSTTQIYHIN